MSLHNKTSLSELGKLNCVDFVDFCTNVSDINSPIVTNNLLINMTKDISTSQTSLWKFWINLKRQMDKG